MSIALVVKRKWIEWKGGPTEWVLALTKYVMFAKSRKYVIEKQLSAQFARNRAPSS